MEGTDVMPKSGGSKPMMRPWQWGMVWGVGVAFLFVMLIGFEMQFFSGLRDLAQGWVEGWIAIGEGKYGEQQGAVGFYLGMLASSFLLALGYVLVWIGWWARQRIGTKAD
jgi:hypothetical protein